MEDEEIRAALRRGDDAAAFRLLVRAHGEAVFTRCYRILRNRTAAEDVMQQALEAAFKHRSQLIQVEQIRGWLIRIATRKSLDALRSSKRADRLERDLAEEGAPEDGSLFEQLGSTQDRRALEECLAALEPDLAAAVQMRYGDGMSWAQIADAVGLPVDTIRMRVQRGALNSLKECLAAKEVTR
ncbi:MAG TPA: RNA polymerase sigma factor [Kofleriaceae bacterium]|nr:RNA polymerase sigma factor [Kofleriaceae bacterium]